MHQIVLDEPFVLEEGGAINQLTICYHTYGQLNREKDNVIWICHALTASSDAAAWWPGLIGPGACFDTDKYFVVCANILGSCYGTTGPLSINPETNDPYYHTFPAITIRDMVKAHQVLCHHLSIQKIQLLVGGSMGGYQALEWCVMEPHLIKNVFLITTSAKESAWGKAIHAAQRMAIEADSSWRLATDDAGKNGLKAARAFGMITYRSYEIYERTQEDEIQYSFRNTKAASYIAYQGEKFANRFNAYSYWLLTYAMDSHHLARGRQNTIEGILGNLKQRALLIGIKSDILCPIQELHFLSDSIKNSTFFAIESIFGHDGFLVETEVISQKVSEFLNNEAPL